MTCSPRTTSADSSKSLSVLPSLPVVCMYTCVSACVYACVNPPSPLSVYPSLCPSIPLSIIFSWFCFSGGPYITQTSTTTGGTAEFLLHHHQLSVHIWPLPFLASLGPFHSVPTQTISSITGLHVQGKSVLEDQDKLKDIVLWPLPLCN